MSIEVLSKLEEKYLNFKLGEEQKEVLLSIFNFILNDKDEWHCTLDGFSGSGKTTITKLIIRFLEHKNIGYTLAAPTHKAKGVLSELTGRDAFTIHQLLSLKPTIDISNLDYKDLQFHSKTIDNNVPRRGILIIDECSMVNEVLFDYISNQAKEKLCKVIWIGDYAQLRPVKDGKQSKAFSINNVYKLTKVYRQAGDNPLLDLFYELRTNPIKKYNPIISDTGSLTLYNDWHKFIDNNIDLFSQSIIEKDPLKVKLIAYTNKRVEAFNNVIRSQLFDNNLEYNIGDLLMAYDSCEYKKNNKVSIDIINSYDYLVKNIYPTEKIITNISFKGYLLTVYSFNDGFDIELFVLAKDNNHNKFTQLASNIENIRLRAVNATNYKYRNMVWVEYFKTMGSFLTPIDLSFDGRIVRKKSIDYGYSITAHKSQGSTYNKILVDMSNILRCTDNIELRQLQYVAMSRTKKDIDMLIKI